MDVPIAVNASCSPHRLALASVKSPPVRAHSCCKWTKDCTDSPNPMPWRCNPGCDTKRFCCKYVSAASASPGWPSVRNKICCPGEENVGPPRCRGCDSEGISQSEEDTELLANTQLPADAADAVVDPPRLAPRPRLLVPGHPSSLPAARSAEAKHVPHRGITYALSRAWAADWASNRSQCTLAVSLKDTTENRYCTAFSWPKPLINEDAASRLASSLGTRRPDACSSCVRPKRTSRAAMLAEASIITTTCAAWGPGSTVGVGCGACSAESVSESG
mmetsp:Transcript_118559/g.272015  ORF Transcript_118559/g.272015 Transcript_118559/m.272015 type:complete len:275 (-) Transcript_118559:341-1165(-)